MEELSKIVNFMTPVQRILCWGMAIQWKFNSFAPLLVYTGEWIRWIKLLVMMSKERPNVIVKLMAHEAGVLVLGHAHISHYSEYALSSTLSIYSTSIAIVLRDCILLPLFYKYWLHERGDNFPCYPFVQSIIIACILCWI